MKSQYCWRSFDDFHRRRSMLRIQWRAVSNELPRRLGSSLKGSLTIILPVLSRRVLILYCSSQIECSGFWKCSESTASSSQRRLRLRSIELAFVLLSRCQKKRRSPTTWRAVIGTSTYDETRDLMDVVVQCLISVCKCLKLRIWTECLSRRKWSRCTKSSVIKFTRERESRSALPSL